VKAKPRILVAFYSRTGVTRQVAQQLASRLGADVLAILDVRSREGMLGYVRSALEAMHGTLPQIAKLTLDARDYDLVVLGSPVWGGHLSSPMRTFLHDCGRELRRIAVFCTMGESGAENAFKDVHELTGVVPEATCALTDGEIFRNGHLDAVDAFAARLRGAPIGARARQARAPGERHVHL
jgi:menaquinone-dependent protoporphyrinogen IX oxidase